MTIDIINKTRNKINQNKVKLIVEKFLKKYKKTKYSISIVFVGDHRIKTLNGIYRGKDKVTDVLAFDGEDDALGEILINFAQIKRQAPKYKNSTNNELRYILIHGLYHLLGHDDSSDAGKNKMNMMTKKFIQNL